MFISFSYGSIQRDCTENICLEGGCIYENCHNPVDCPGGACFFRNCINSSCSGGACKFDFCQLATCGGGGCSFLNPMSTLVDGYCLGENCDLDGVPHPVFSDYLSV